MSDPRFSRPPASVSVSAGDATDDPSVVEPQWKALAALMARAVRRQCPAWLSDQAQDIAQAALMKVIAAARRAEGERPLSSLYLHRAAHSALVDEIRKRARRPEVPLDASIGDADSSIVEPRAQGNPESVAAFRQLGVAVRDCMLNVKRERRLALTLYLQGHSVREAAHILGWDTKRTENLIYRGLADLRQCLMAKGHRP